MNYEDIVKAFPWELKASETFGSYQGDHVFVFTRKEIEWKESDRIDLVKVGILVQGYGSCSYCDELEGADTRDWEDEDKIPWWEIDDVRQIATSMFSNVSWYRDNIELEAHMMVKNPWHWHDDEIKNFIRHQVAEITKDNPRNLS